MLAAMQAQAQAYQGAGAGASASRKAFVTLCGLGAMV